MNEAKISERSERINKLNELKSRKISPYPAKTAKEDEIRNVLDNFDVLMKNEKTIRIAGRLRGIRSHGNLTFAHLEDETGKIQIAISKKEVGDEHYKIFIKLIDIGDFLEVGGICFITHKGENSIMVKDWKLLSKALRPLPDKWHGLQDEEEKLRKRYLDILFNPKLKELFIKKSKFWSAIRSFLSGKGFLEVETPVLEVTTGGADARPFTTHHNALNIDVYLRISMGELWQKRLMVAGFDKTFEIGRQFRNEGMDAEHLQDYTQMEFYWAYADYEKGMDLVEELYKFVAQQAFGTLKFKIGKFDVDLGKKWERYDYRDTVKKYTGIDILDADIKQIEKKLKELKIEYDKKGFNITRAIDNLWKYCRKQVGGPGFLIGVPVEISPLAKKDDNNPRITQRFQPIIAGSELGNGYSELNDPIDQAERFAAQQKLREAGDDEAQMFDHEFVEALEYGMPPTCGFGMSERVFAFLADKSARECQIFPLMRPKEKTLSNSRVLNNSNSDNIKLGINNKDAHALLDKYIKDEATKLHCLESEAIMRELAAHFGEDKEKWGIIGLLHDIDWELTKNNPSEHCMKAAKILKDAGGSDFLINTIISHNYGYEFNEELKDKKRQTKLQYSLAAAETLTGLIIASVLVQPDKKLEKLELNSLKKKFNSKKFAAKCNRDIIMECEKCGIALDEFLEIGLKALKGIADKLSF